VIDELPPGSGSSTVGEPVDGGPGDRDDRRDCGALVQPVGGVGTGERGVEADEQEHGIARQVDPPPDPPGEPLHGE